MSILSISNIKPKNYDLYNEIVNNIQNSNNILFGPILSEFGWEIIIWAGIIRRFKIDNSDKRVMVLTRNNRTELYKDVVDEVIGFDIDGDYSNISPRANNLYEIGLNNNYIKHHQDYANNFKLTILDLKLKYDDLKVIDTSILKHSNTPPTNLSKLYYKFKSKNQNNLTYVDHILDNNKDKNIIVLNPRHRPDLTHRNMCKESWYELYEYFETLNDCVFFVSGVSRAYIEPNRIYNNIVDIEDLTKNNSKLTVLGLTIELMRHSKILFGMESAHLHLAKSMNVPMLFIGDDSYSSMASSNWNVFKNYKFKAIPPDKIDSKTREYILDLTRVKSEFDKFLKDSIR